MISLLFKILADATGWRKVVTQDMPKDAKKAGKDAGKAAGSEFGQQMKSALMSYIGAGAILGVFNQQITKARETMTGAADAGASIEGFQVLQKMMEATGKSLEDLQKLAKDSPEAFKALADAAEQLGGIVPEADIKRLAEAKIKIGEFTSGVAQGFAFLTDTIRQAWYGLNAGLGAVESFVGNVTGSSALKERGAKLTSYAEAGAEKMINGSGLSDIDSAARMANVAIRNNADWEAMGGNVDWSAQSRTVRARDDLKELERLAKEQLDAAKEQARQLKDLNETMRM